MVTPATPPSRLFASPSRAETINRIAAGHAGTGLAAGPGGQDRGYPEQVDIIAIDGKLLASPAPGQPAGPSASGLRGDTRRIEAIGLLPYQARPGTLQRSG